MTNVADFVYLAPMRIGATIREMRKRRGMSMEQLAGLLEISYTTLHRIETNKISPSVSLLSEIAYHLGRSIHEFLKSEPKQFRLVKAGTSTVVGTGKLKLQMLAPRGAINDRISINVGELEPGAPAKIQIRKGFDFFYIISGKGLMKFDSVEYEIDEGDALYYDSSVPHSWFAKTAVKFVSINIRKD